MTVMDVFFGKSDDRRDAENELRRREDDMMRMDALEETSLPVHAKADAERLAVVLSRLRVVQTTSEQMSNRNLLATLISGVAVVAIIKGGGVWEWLGRVLGL